MGAYVPVLDFRPRHLFLALPVLSYIGCILLPLETGRDETPWGERV